MAPIFFALPKLAKGTVAIGRDKSTGRLTRLAKGESTLFHIAADLDVMGRDYLQPLYEWRRLGQGMPAYVYSLKPPSKGKLMHPNLTFLGLL